MTGSVRINATVFIHILHCAEPLAPETIPPISLKQSSHAPPLPPSALRQLLLVEVKLAELRNCLYLERMEEAAAEEEMILEGESRYPGEKSHCP